MYGYYSMDAVHAAYDQMCKDFGNLGIELENALQENEQLKQENEQLKADIRGKDNEINDLKAIIAYLKKFEPRRNEAVREGSV